MIVSTEMYQPPKPTNESRHSVGKEAGDYQAGINKCIFELAVASQELMAEEWDVLDVVEKAYVYWEVWRKVGEMDRF